MKYAHIIHYAMSRPWALLPEKLFAIQSFLALKAGGGDVDPADIQAMTSAARPSEPRSMGSVAVVPLLGVLTQRGGVTATSEPLTSVERFARTMRETATNPDVAAILIEVDSPGGEVFGVEEAANVVAELATGDKPIVAIASSLAASAAYWIASQANELVVTPSGQVGSIGVYGMHQDVSKLQEQLGVKTTLISAGAFKTEGNPFEPLTEAARAAMQGEVDSYYRSFTAAVARGRGTTPAAVRDGYGRGRVVGAQEAVKVGLADRVGTIDETIARLGNPRQRARVGKRSEGDQPVVVVLEEASRAIDAGTSGGNFASPDAALVDLDYRRRRARLHAGSGAT